MSNLPAAVDPSSITDSLTFVTTRPTLVLVVLVAAWLTTRLARRVIRSVVRRVADRSRTHPGGAWRTRVPRLFGESPELAEQRRRQRVDATSKMLAHVFSIVAWSAAGLAVLHLLGIEPVVLLGGAGFIGAGLAIGGQNTVKDYLAGLSVLLEDRYGIGDRIVVETGQGPVEGVVDHIGSVSTRLRDGEATWHLANSTLANVRNLSQVPVTTELEVLAAATASGDAAQAAAGAVQRAAGGPDLTGVILIDDVEAVGADDGTVRVAVRTPRPLTAQQEARLRDVVARELSGEPTEG